MSIPFLKPLLPLFNRWECHINKTYEAGWFSNNGVLVQQFEENLREYLQTDRHIVVVNNATIGLQVAIKALKVEGPILIPSFTFAATAGAISWCGLKYEYVDIDNTWCMSPALTEKMLQSNKYGAIMPVHTLGNPCSVVEFERLGRQYNIPVIFDAAAAIGAKYDKRIGNFGDIEVFSLHATKCLPVGEGGFLSIKDPEVAERVRMLKNFGFAGDRTAHIDGTNAKMPEVSAAIGIEALKDLPQHMYNRRQYVELYKSLLHNVVEFQPVLPGAEHGYQILNIFLDRDATSVMQELANRGIQTRQYFLPLHLQPAYRSEVSLPETTDVSKCVISLPLYSVMEEGIIEIVCNNLKDIL